jgi:hypothetical protein
VALNTRGVDVCGFVLTGGGATSATLVRGTGTTCGTGTTALTGPMELGDNTTVTFGNGTGRILTQLAPGQALCITNGAAIQLSGVVSFAR